MLPINKIYVDYQKTGKYIGTPAIFIELHGCNLNCIRFDKTECKYLTSSSTSGCDDIIKYFNTIKSEYPKINHIVITGGEPLLHKKSLEEFLSEIYEYNMKIIIETNGTLPVLNPLHKKFKIDMYIVSVKLSNTENSDTPNVYHNTNRLNYKNLVDIIMSSNNYIFKFDYYNLSIDSFIKEIENIYIKMAVIVENTSGSEYIRNFYFNNHPNKHTFICNYSNNPEISELVKICYKKNWNYMFFTQKPE